MSHPEAAKIWAIVPAAGSGQRMRSELPKQYLKIGELTVLQHTIGLLERSPSIQRIVLCTAADDHRWAKMSLDVLQADGGATRAQSVLNGLAALSDIAAADDWVLVHDAARPCLDAQVLERFIEQLGDHAVGGLLAIPCKDTLKQASRDSAQLACVDRTIDRSQIWQAQTPQMFRFGLLRDTLTAALKNGLTVTDEASALEQAGYAPRLIEGESSNIKITTPEDLKLAEFLLNQ